MFEDRENRKGVSPIAFKLARNAFVHCRVHYKYVR